MKKTIIFGISLVVALLAFSSCSQSRLEIPQKGVVAYEAFYDGSEESAESAALSAYAAGIKAHNLGAAFSPHVIAPSYFVLTNAPSDDIYYGSGSAGDHVFGLEINEYRPSFGSNSDVIANDYKGFYQFIYACNLVIDNFEYGKSAQIDKNISEARVLRALAHLHLATFWGTPPLVDHIIGGDARPTNTDNAELLAWIIKELDESAAYLPSRSSKTDANGAIRLTKEAAWALEGKAQVQAKDYNGAKATLKKVIDSGKFDLVPPRRRRQLREGLRVQLCEQREPERFRRLPPLPAQRILLVARPQVPARPGHPGHRLGRRRQPVQVLYRRHHGARTRFLSPSRLGHFL